MRRTPSMLMLVLAASAYAQDATGSGTGTNQCILHFGLSESVPLSTLQFTIDYSNVQGSFVGSGLAVRCESPVTNASVTASDNCHGGYAECQWGTDRRLAVAVIGGPSFAGSGVIARCKFVSAELPAKTDFGVTVDATSAPETFEPIDPSPSVEILSIDCRR